VLKRLRFTSQGFSPSAVAKASPEYYPQNSIVGVHTTVLCSLLHSITPHYYRLVGILINGALPYNYSIAILP